MYLPLESFCPSSNLSAFKSLYAGLIVKLTKSDTLYNPSSSKSVNTLSGLYSYLFFSLPFSSNSINVAYFLESCNDLMTEPFTLPLTFR